MRKEFILGVEEALTDTNITLSFDGDNDVTIPLVVLENLYNYKGDEEKKILASKLIEYIKEFPYKNLKVGCKQRNGSILRVVDNGPISKKIRDMHNLSVTQKRIFQVCLDRRVKDKNGEANQVILISQNPATGIQAAELDIKSQPLREKIFPPLEKQYTGVYNGSTSQTVIDAFYQNGEISVKDIYGYENVEWQENMFVTLQGERGNSIFGRYTQGKVVKLKHLKKSKACAPINSEQKYLIEALEAPAEEVPLVIVKGDAGTGKTYCTLSVALNKLAKYSDDEVYSQILVAAPTVTIDEDLGYLPGEIDEKVGPYLGGFKDNLSTIFKNQNSELDNKKIDFNVRYLFEQKLITIQPIGFLRGRSIQNSIFIIDECQNIKPKILKDIVTRIGKGTKLVLLGDPSQVNKAGLNSSKNGLTYVAEKFKGNLLCYQITMSKPVRGKLAEEALKVLSD